MAAMAAMVAMVAMATMEAISAMAAIVDMAAMAAMAKNCSSNFKEKIHIYWQKCSKSQKVGCGSLLAH